VDLKDKSVIVTGAGSGIGQAIARRIARESPRGLVIADRDEVAINRLASEIAATPVKVDVASAPDNQRLVETSEQLFGPIDLFCANAGIAFLGDEQTSTEDWDRMWQVNTMSHVHAARYLLPGWLSRGAGYFLSTASAAGLLTNLKAAQYSVTKHAAVAFSEWLAVTYGDQGIKVSCLCPMGVDTPLLDVDSEFRKLLEPDAIPAEAVADAVVAGVADEKFLILPHPEVARYLQNKANDYDRWIEGMQKLQRSVFPNQAMRQNEPYG
jgi:NAD(P)-dependent dehydrogenase (short-subunit alcohol dehydrogenase family)